MSKVFVSYSRDDEVAARAVTADLSDLGHQVWYDQALRGGEDWWTSILTNIQRCDVFLVCVSVATLQSEACEAEWSYAIAWNRPLLPVLVDNVDLTTIPSALRAHQLLWYCGKDRRDALIELHRAVTAVGQAAPPPPTPPARPPLPGRYMMGLADRASVAHELSVQEQTYLLADLEAALLAGGDKARDALSILTKMLTRGDLLFTTVNRINELVASAPRGIPTDHSSSVAGRRGTGRPGTALAAPHLPPPPPKRSGGQGRKVVLILGAIVASMVLIGGCIALLASPDICYDPSTGYSYEC